MAIPRFLWLDDRDIHLSSSRLKEVREKQLSKWVWMLWNEESYESSADAESALISEITMVNMFGTGKVVYAYGMPKFHAKIAQELSSIPNNVMLVLIAPINKTYAIYKKAKELEKEKKVKIEEVADLTKANVLEWLAQRAEMLGVQLDDTSGKMLVDIIGFSHGKLHMEMIKLRDFAAGGVVRPWMVQQLCVDSGQADVKDMCTFMVKGDSARAHEYMQRLLDRGEDPIKIGGFVIDWARKLAVAASCDGNFDSIKGKLSTALKWDKEEKKSGPLFPNVGAVYYSCEALRSGDKDMIWAYSTIKHFWAFSIDARKCGNDKAMQSRLAHTYVEALCG